MNNRASLLRISAAALTVSAASCVHAQADRAVNLRDLSQQASSFNEKQITVSGYLQKEPFGGYYLYSDRSTAVSEDYSSGVDVVVPTSQLRAQIEAVHEGGCAVLSGGFTSFDDSVIAIGYFRSKVGRIDVEKIQIEPCEQ